MVGYQVAEITQQSSQLLPFTILVNHYWLLVGRERSGARGIPILFGWGSDLEVVLSGATKCWTYN